jgi:hypothetical protein
MQPDSLPRHAGQKGPKPQGPSALNLPSALRRRRSPPVQVWIAPGLGLGDDFVATLSAISSDSSVVMLTILLVFALAHSGLAFLRPYGAPRCSGTAGGGPCRTTGCCGAAA